jgi:class 3 adenylate cyclase
MEPRIQYAQTKDGVSIAFSTMGEGMPFLCLPTIPYSHCKRTWEFPEFRRWFERLAEKRRLIWYDNRGSGLSDREVTDCSLDALLLDLEAVVERLKLERFVLYAELHGGPLAISYAARHPDQVSHLILWCAWARATDFFGSPRVRAFGRVLERDWESYTEAASHAMAGWSHGDYAHRAASYLRDCVTEEAAKAAYRAMRRFDVSELLREVSASTLVLHPEGFPHMDMDIPRGLASALPDARLTLVEGDASTPIICDVDAIAEAIDEFLGEGEEAPAELPEGMAVLLFADIAESTALTERLGDAAFRGKARELDTSLRSVIKDSGGTPVEGKVLGDGVLAVFTSARQAIECALRCDAASQPLGLQLHLGIHAGDVIREGNNVYGGAVNIAARIATASQPGEVLVSDTVRSLGRTSADVSFDDRGEHTLKGVGEPQRLFAVRGGG